MDSSGGGGRMDTDGMCLTNIGITGQFLHVTALVKDDGYHFAPMSHCNNFTINTH